MRGSLGIYRQLNFFTDNWFGTQIKFIKADNFNIPFGRLAEIGNWFFNRFTLRVYVQFRAVDRIATFFFVKKILTQIGSISQIEPI